MSIEPSEHLSAAIEQLSDDINGLLQVVEEGTLLKQLVDEVRVLRNAIDDLRAEVEWAARNLFQCGEPRPLPEPVSSMPLDPCDPAFARKLNTVSRNEVPADEDEPMLDDDAECFRDDNSYPLDVEEEEAEPEPMKSEASPGSSPPQPPPPSNGVPRPPASSPPPGPSPAPRVTPSTNRKRRPLATRLFLHRHLEALVRLVGHDEHLAEDFHHMVQPLFERHGEESIKEAIDELVSFSHRKKVAYARLKPEVAKLAVQIIGKPQAPKRT